MELARISVSGVRATVTAHEPVPAGIVGATVRLCYDEHWEGLRKTLVFRGEVSRDVTDAGETAVIPAEVVAKPGASLLVGVYGTDREGELVIPTLWADVGRIRSAADPSGDESTDPLLPVWAQILKQMGSLEELTTEAKDSLVAAVNEAARKEGVEESVVWQMVERYLRENPAADLTGYATEEWVRQGYARKEEVPEVPVLSVNGKTGTVELDAGAVGAEPAGRAASAVAEHNADGEAHSDLRQELKNLAAAKVAVADIVNDLLTDAAGKPLSAAQGMVLKAMIDAITVPVKLSQLANDAGYLTGYTETDPTVPAWAKAASKPSYSKSEIGLGNVDNVKQYSASNPPPYPVSSVNGKTGDVTLDTLTVTGVDADGVSHSWTVYGVAV